MRALALLLGIGLTVGTLRAQGPAVVSGVVRDESGAPIREALVVIDPDSLSLRTRSDAEGRYRISGVPNGRYEVRIVRIGFKPISRTIDVTGSSTEVAITMQSVPIPLDTVAVRVSRPGLYGLVVTRGINLLPHGPRPLSSAGVEVLNEPYRVRSGSDGRFSIPQLPIGSHTIMVTLDRYATRLVPVTVPPDGGVDITFTLDSLYAEYQYRDQDVMRGISARMRNMTSPATFVSAHEIDPDAPNLHESLRYANAVLSRGIILQNAKVCIYIDGVPRPDLILQDVSPTKIAGIEVYPANTLQLSDRIAKVNPGTPCGGVEGEMFSGGVQSRARNSGPRTLMRTRGNQAFVVMIWTERTR